MPGSALPARRTTDQPTRGNSRLLKAIRDSQREFYERVDDLTAEDQEVLVVLLNSLIKRSQVAHLMSA